MFPNVSMAPLLWLAEAATNSSLPLQLPVERWQADLVAPVFPYVKGANQGPLLTHRTYGELRSSIY